MCVCVCMYGFHVRTVYACSVCMYVCMRLHLLIGMHMDTYIQKRAISPGRLCAYVYRHAHTHIHTYV